MKLAIKGHATHSKKVIEILEMLGGNNANNHYGNHCDKVYYINENGYINHEFIFRIERNTKFIIFSLEEFLEKFPYKVGDKVSSKYLKNYKIVKIEWENINNRVIYKIQGMGWYSVDELQPYKEEAMEEININRIGFNGDKAKLILTDGYEFKTEGKDIYIIKKKPQYPKTYEECCDILDIYPIYNKPNLCICEWHPETREMHEHYSKLANLSQKDIAFMILRICRNAYWKIAGDWKPDWKNGLSKFCIAIHEDQILICSYVSTNFTLAFPTEEMRDAFYENFKDLIEQCKELL